MASPDQCAELGRIEAALVVAAGTPDKASARMTAELELHRKNLGFVGGPTAIEECTRTRSVASIECARRARSLADLEACGKKVPGRP